MVDKMNTAPKGPGRNDRKGITMMELFRMFPDDKTAEEWFVKERWPGGVCCVRCGSLNVQERKTRKPQPYRCRDCRKDFSVKTDTMMHSSNLGFQIWAVAMYIFTTGLKGTSSMKLHRDLGIAQTSAWHLAHRLREVWNEASGHDPNEPFKGPVEIDEGYFGGRNRNRHAADRLPGRGPSNMAPVVGIRDRRTRHVVAQPVDSVNRRNIVEMLDNHVSPDARVYSDDAMVYEGVSDAMVKHSAGEYVRGKVHTNGMESFWSMMKRGYKGTYHKMSPKHLHRYANEFAGRQNIRDLDTIDQMKAIAGNMHRKKLRYKDLTQRQAA